MDKRLEPAYRATDKIVQRVNGRSVRVAMPGDFLSASDAKRLGLDVEPAVVRTADVPAPKAAAPAKQAKAKAKADEGDDEK